jgi:hypothetical protein
MDHGNAKGCCDSFDSTTTTTTRWILVPNTLERDNATTRNVAHTVNNDHTSAAAVAATVGLPRPGHAVYSRVQHHQYETCLALKEPTTDRKDSTAASSSSSTRVNNENGQLARVALTGNLTETTLVIPPHKLNPLYAAETAAEVAGDVPFLHETADVPSIPILVTERTDVYRLLAATQLLHNPTASRHKLPVEMLPANAEDTTINDATIASDSGMAVVLEIGTSTGGTSEIVWRQAKAHAVLSHWIGLDTSQYMVQTVQAKLEQFLATTNTTGPHEKRYACRHLDPLMDPDTAALLVRSHFDTGHNATPPHYLTVLIDIGGNREERAVVRMIQWVLQSFASSRLDGKNRVIAERLILHQIIVKSETVYAALQEQLHQGVAINQQSLHAWYQSRWRVARQASVPRHALQAPKRLVPTTLTNDAIGADNNDSTIGYTPICRYHNYDKRRGCLKRQCPNDPCPYNHDHCHWCRAVGHVAYNCPQLTAVHATSENHQPET